MMRKFLTSSKRGSLLNKFRKRRFTFFLEKIQDIERPVMILDVGGEVDFWDSMDLENRAEFKITILNVQIRNAHRRDFILIKGDGRDMHQFADKSFDLVFSNATIEHLPSFSDQTRMAREIKRVGKKYFVQTPNRYFPIEPHFIFPFFQFCPHRLQIYMLTHFNMGFFTKTNRAQAEEVTNNIRLLTQSELKILFPKAKIYKEKVCGLTKSFTAYEL